ncbi:MAG: KH domain-containing protein [Verrucomicrobia bacterium]|nr:KH domain-containing protein [Verrucomicrobiota bacterium]
MRAFLEYVVKGLVNHPEAVTVTPVERSGLTIYELRLHPEEVGRVVGRKGNTINAIRSLLQVGDVRKGKRSAVEIVEDQPAV